VASGVGDEDNRRVEVVQRREALLLGGVAFRIGAVEEPRCIDELETAAAAGQQPKVDALGGEGVAAHFRASGGECADQARLADVGSAGQYRCRQLGVHHRQATQRITCRDEEIEAVRHLSHHRGQATVGALSLRLGLRGRAGFMRLHSKTVTQPQHLLARPVNTAQCLTEAVHVDSQLQQGAVERVQPVHRGVLLHDFLERFSEVVGDGLYLAGTQFAGAVARVADTAREP